MLPVPSVQVYGTLIPESDHVQDIEWGCIPSSLAPLMYHVYRSIDKSSWSRLDQSGIWNNVFRDTTAYKNHTQVYYYAVTWEDQLGVESPVTEATMVRAHPVVRSAWVWNYILENQRRKRWWLNQVGEWVYLCKRKLAGTVCNACRDVRTRQISSSFCTVCYGTGIEGGYVTFLTKLRLRSQTDTVKSLPLGLSLPQDIIAWNVDWPPLSGGELGDFFVREDGGRYVLQDVHGQSIQGYRQYQMAKVAYIDPGNPLYLFPMPTENMRVDSQSYQA